MTLARSKDTKRISDDYDANPKLRRDKKLLAFLDHVTERRMSKEGRFIRVHFKTGAQVDLVPAKSIASGMTVVSDGGKRRWRDVSPSIEKLWDEFENSRDAKSNTK